MVFGVYTWRHLRWERREITNTDTSMLFGSHLNRCILSETQAPSHMSKKTWSSQTTQAPPVIALPKGLQCRLPLHTIIKQFFFFCLDSVSALIVFPFPQSGNRQQRNTAIFILGVYCKCHSQRVEVSKFGTKLCFEAPTLLFSSHRRLFFSFRFFSSFFFFFFFRTILYTDISRK